MNPRLAIVGVDLASVSGLTETLGARGFSVSFLKAAELRLVSEPWQGGFALILMASAAALTPEGAQFAALARRRGVPVLLVLEDRGAGLAGLKAFPAAGAIRAGEDAEVLDFNVRSALGTEQPPGEAAPTDRAILDTLPDLLFVVDYNGVYLDFHSRQSHLLLHTPAEFLGKRIADNVPPEVAEVEMRSIRAAHEHGTSLGRRFRLAVRGTVRWFEVSVSSIPGNFEVPRFVLLVHDITEAVKTETALGEHRNLLETVLWTVEDAIFIKDNDGAFLVANPGAAKWLGLESAADMIGRNQAELAEGSDLESMAATDRAVQESGKPVEYEQTFTLGGKNFTHRTRKYPWKDSQGAPGGIVGISSDITDLKNLEARIVEQNEKLSKENSMKDRLFTILAHDLKGPIGGLATLMAHLNSLAFEDPDVTEILGESERTAQRTYSLLESLLDWIQAHQQGTDAPWAAVAVGACLHRIRDWVESQAGPKGVAISVECPENLTVFTDERIVETIVRNLLSNAVKYSPPGSTVTVTGGEDGEGVVVSVADCGVGIDPETVTKLFGTEKVHSRPGTSDEKGTGLGLMFSSDLAKVVGGTLRVESVLGKGSTFALVLPRRSEAGA